MGPSQRALELDSEMCVPILHLPSYQVGKLFKSPVAASIIVSLFVKSVHNKYLAGLLPGFRREKDMLLIGGAGCF